MLGWRESTDHVLYSASVDNLGLGYCEIFTLLMTILLTLLVAGVGWVVLKGSKGKHSNRPFDPNDLEVQGALDSVWCWVTIVGAILAVLSAIATIDVNLIILGY